MRRDRSSNALRVLALGRQRRVLAGGVVGGLALCLVVDFPPLPLEHESQMLLAGEADGHTAGRLTVEPHHVVACRQQNLFVSAEGPVGDRSHSAPHVERRADGVAERGTQLVGASRRQELPTRGIRDGPKAGQILILLVSHPEADHVNRDLPDFLERVQSLKEMPIWVFHGAKDPVVPVHNSEEIVQALRDVGGDVRYMEYPEAGHDSWTETYNNPDFYRWLLDQTRSGSDLVS